MLHPPRYFRAPIAAGAALSLVLTVAPAGVGAAADTLSAATTSDGGDRSRCQVTVSAKLVPSCGVWFGVGPNPYGDESYDQALVNFEARIGRTVDISHYYARGQSTLFPTSGMLMRANEPGRERLMLINWKPSGLTWRAVADGAADGYLRSLAQHMKAVYPDPFFLSVNAEPEDEVNPVPGSGMTALDFRAFFRHTVEVLRANGAGHAVTVMNYMGAPHWPLQPWFEDLYPGNDVVDWLAEDQYAFGDEPGVWLSDFAGMVDRHYDGADWPGFYTWAQRNYPSKPIMLGEWGVSEEPVYPQYKPDFFYETPLQRREDFPAIKALVYWDTHGDTMMGDTRPHSSQTSLAAYKYMVTRPGWIRPGEQYLDRPAMR